MILTTTQQIEGHTIREYKGVVTDGSHQWNGGYHLKVFADDFNDIMDVYKNGNKKGNSSRKEAMQQS